MQDIIKVLIYLAQKLAGVQQINRELDAVIESCGDGILITDGPGKAVRVNKAVERITGLKPEFVLGKNPADLEDGVKDKCPVPEVFRKREPVTVEQVFAGTGRTLVTGHPIFDEDGNVTGAVIIMRPPGELNELKIELEHARRTAEKYHREINELRTLGMGAGRLVANSKAMRDVLDVVQQVAPLRTAVLLLGKAGVGKEMVAGLIHLSSGREGLFIKASCRAIPDGMLESILFGREQPGETVEKGLFEMARGGTLFIKEVADIPTEMQNKLLTAVQEGHVTRVGGTRPVSVDVRVIAATEKNLNKLIKNGKFRKDLGSGLNAVTITIPPLHKRREDIPLLLQYYTRIFNEKYDTSKRLSAKVVELLVDYEWPDNVRELVNLVERLIVTVEHKLILPKHLPSYIFKNVGAKVNENFKPLKEAVAELEFELIKNAVDIYGSTYKAANILGVSQPTVVRKLQKYAKKMPEVPVATAAEGN